MALSPSMDALPPMHLPEQEALEEPQFDYDMETETYHRVEPEPASTGLPSQGVFQNSRLIRRQTSAVVFVDSAAPPPLTAPAAPTTHHGEDEEKSESEPCNHPVSGTHAYFVDLAESTRQQQLQWDQAPFLERLDLLRVNLYHKILRDFIPESIWVILTMLAAGMSLIAWVVDEVTEHVAEFRNNIYQLPRLSVTQLEDEQDVWNPFFRAQTSLASFFLVWIWMIFWGLMAVAICKYMAPQAAGSGIEQIRSIMTGYQIPGFLTVHTLVAKILALICVQASNLKIGKEGPFVHIAASYGNVLLELPMFREIKASRALAKLVIGAACCSGIASTFGSPVGGVLFAIEVTSNVFHTSDYWKSFYTAVVGNLIFRVLSYFGSGRSSQISLFPTSFPAQAYTLTEFPLFIVLSVVAGFYGGYFVKIILGVRIWRVDTQQKAVAYFSNVERQSPQLKTVDGVFHHTLHEWYMYATYYLLRPWAWTFTVLTLHCFCSYTSDQFMKRSLYAAIGDFLVNGEMSQNDWLGTSADHRLHNTDWGNPNLILNLMIYLVFSSVLFALAMSLPVPSGTMIVMMSIGLSLGRLFGELARIVFNWPTLIPGGYAMVGASAYLAGTTGAISTAVIMFEITGQLSFMVPVLVSVIIGRACGKVISPDIYEALQITRNLPNIPPLSRQSSYGIPARDLMEHNNIPYLPRYCTLIRLTQLLEGESFRHQGAVNEDDLFAIVTNDHDRHYMVSVSRAQLKMALQTAREAYEIQEEEERGIGALLDLFSAITMNAKMTPACPYNVPCIDVLHMFEVSLASTMFVTENCRVIGWIELAAFKHRIEHTNL
ncbi:hypothetical protein BASA81_015070 [Batrachochytrium salamandrivorans]|nr:hypothetical protein BASA81_015070 [Batrachochytrium salamandrivorans]